MKKLTILGSLLMLALIAAALTWPSSPAAAAPGAQPSDDAVASTNGAGACTNPYRVRSGDTLGGIAARCRTTVANLKRWNGLRSNVIRPGQTLITRVTTVRAPAARTPGKRVAAPSSRPRAVATPRIDPVIPP